MKLHYLGVFPSEALLSRKVYINQRGAQAEGGLAIHALTRSSAWAKFAATVVRGFAEGFTGPPSSPLAS